MIDKFLLILPSRTFKVEVLKDHSFQDETPLPQAANDYIRQVEDIYQREGCWPLNSCSDDNFLAKIVSNPIYCYQVRTKELQLSLYI